MKIVEVSDAELREAAAQGVDSFLNAIINAIHSAIGGELSADNMPQLNSDQITLLAYETLHNEVMDGGMVQLIHNGYGPFIFKNPFAKVLGKIWGMRDLSKMLYDTHTLYIKHKDELERDCSDEEFMALFERFPEFDDFDDHFIENEEQYTEQVAKYVDNHLSSFVTITTN